VLFCIALVALTSNVFGLGEEIEVTPTYIAENKEKFDVKVVMCEEGVKFTFIAFVGEPPHRYGEIKIRKDDRTIVECLLRPSKDPTRVLYTFTVSQDVISESEFILCEGGQSMLGREAMQGATHYRFRLQSFIRGAKSSK